MNSTSQNRLLHFDILRIIAAFSVVMLHSASQFWYELPITDTNWIITNSYNALFRFGVPIFVMISGALFLNPEKEINIKRLYTHNIIRILILFLVWSCIYGLYDCKNFDHTAITWKDYLREMIMGRYHLWFLPMIAGIYCIIPILHNFVKHAEEKMLKYFLELFFIFQIGVYTLKAFVSSRELLYLLELIDIPMVCSYTGYFLLGYYLAYIGINHKYHKWLYIGAVISAICNVLFGNILSQREGAPIADIYDSYGLFTCIIVIAIYVYFTTNKDRFVMSSVCQKMLQEISACTLGVYVMHVGLMEILKNSGFHPLSIPIVIGVPLFSVVCFIICLLISAILRRIPYVGKYLC